MLPFMAVRFELNGAEFIRNAEKARRNAGKHDGVTFQQAAEAAFDPFLRIVEADRREQSRDAVIGYDTSGRLLFVVHVAFEKENIRIISARKATPEEHKSHDS
ncbi:MAG: BrnT family toxin [Xanthomonadaceae bacterium]|nr:BrnT family toxin [Xanthomonadaceae bacterium]MDP2184150.1 BrnT family toxin [Xanthomonadales bacterium]MDZ4116454.1 BrnT family toxin [Xanthomonadaceae bacterium]MDZ4378280.1 BrnT family toxin [Xanthomonadaceae bacterium]